ncbi:hypothetical protein AO265_07950 [Pseudomonas sp. ABAC61]|nr:hypothetical protein AO265_07950 [Pseudomonas sp. ABAC61]
MQTPGNATRPCASTCARLQIRTPTGLPAAAERSWRRVASSVAQSAKGVWFSELRYSLNDLDSMMFGESAGMLNSPMATTGLPEGSSQDNSKQFQKSTPLYGRVSALKPSSAHFAARGIGNSSEGV